MSRRLTLFAVFGVLLLVITACSDSSPTETTEAPAGTSADQDPGSAADDGGNAVAPTGEPLIAGLSEIVVLGPPSSEAGEAPQFRWEPVAAAASYGLVVLGSDGPIWAWQGEETGVWLGGLPFDSSVSGWCSVLSWRCSKSRPWASRQALGFCSRS